MDTITKSIADYHGISTLSQLFEAIKNSLTFFSQEFMEVPYIWTYKRDLITKNPTTTALSRADLWHILDLEYEFRKFLEMKDQLNSEISNKQCYSYTSNVLSEAKTINDLHEDVHNFQEKKKVNELHQ